MLHITPEVHDLCEEDSVELRLERGLFEASAVTTTPSPPQKPASHSSEALFGSELCSLLASLEAAILRLSGEGFGGHDQDDGEVS
jgi:hypothetical protein